MAVRHSLLVVAFLAAGCANSVQQTPAQPSSERIAAGRFVIDDFDARRVEMLRRFPPARTGSEGERRAAAEELIDAHQARRAELGVPYEGPGRRDSDLAFLVRTPVLHVENAQREETRRLSQSREAILARLDGRQLTGRDVAEAAAAWVDATGGTLSQGERRAALEAAQAEVRAALEGRRRAAAAAASTRREAELVRVAGTGLADMPREIAMAAEENLRDARSPFDTRTAWRPEPAALRQEEVRLRDAVARRRDEQARAVHMNAVATAEAARRDAILQQCRMQAAMMGAAVPSPYMGRGLGGAVASGLVGAIRQAEMEAGALNACLRASGL